MSINAKFRLTILASAFAIAAAAPVAFAQGAGTWSQGFHNDPPTGAPDADGARHSKEVMEKKIAPSNVAANTGTIDKWGFHTDPPTGAPDADGARHSKEVMEKKIAPSNVAANTGTTDKWGFHTDPPTGAPDADGARHGKAVMEKTRY